MASFPTIWPPSKAIVPLTVTTAQIQLLPLVRLHRDNIRSSFQEMQTVGFIDKNCIPSEGWIDALENEVNRAIQFEGLCAEIAIGKTLVHLGFLFRGERWLAWHINNHSTAPRPLWTCARSQSPTYRNTDVGRLRNVAATALPQLQAPMVPSAPWPSPPGTPADPRLLQLSTADPRGLQSRSNQQSHPCQRPRQRRLHPHQPSTLSNGLKSHPGIRFCWNVGFFLQSFVQHEPIRTDHRTFESLAENLNPVFIDSEHCFRPSEHEALRCNGLAIAEYRSIRARVLIGLALIYEHNLRGARLQHPTRTHAACRPDLGRCYKMINYGKTQAQEVCYGSDVSRASLVYTACQQAGHIPAEEVLKDRSRHRSDEAEACWPAEPRKKLYARLLGWYDGLGVPAELRFVIEDDEEGSSNEAEEGLVEEEGEAVRGTVAIAHEGRTMNWDVRPPSIR